MGHADICTQFDEGLWGRVHLCQQLTTFVDLDLSEGDHAFLGCVFAYGGKDRLWIVAQRCLQVWSREDVFAQTFFTAIIELVKFSVRNRWAKSDGGRNVAEIRYIPRRTSTCPGAVVRTQLRLPSYAPANLEKV